VDKTQRRQGLQSGKGFRAVENSSGFGHIFGMMGSSGKAKGGKGFGIDSESYECFGETSQ